MKNIAIFGSTGSIGVQSLEVIEENASLYSVKLISAHKNLALLKKQILRFYPKYVFTTDEATYNDLVSFTAAMPIRVFLGWADLKASLQEAEIEFAICAISGAAGIFPTLMAIEAKIDIGLANKETLVAGGDYVKICLEKSASKLMPIDSEHSAIFQCLEGQDKAKKLILTASGGPFRTYSFEGLSKVKAADALKHPTWQMGQKISIDSATLMNKGLEVIEAHHLFNMPYDQIDVVVHKESVVHSMVVFNDGAYLAQLGPSDMKLPIAYALSYPKRLAVKAAPFSLTEYGALHFEKPDFEKFKALKLAYMAGKMGGSMPTVLNAANEIAVAAFLADKIGFLNIVDIVEEVMQKHKVEVISSYEMIVNLDKWARSEAGKLLKRYGVN